MRNSYLIGIIAAIIFTIIIVAGIIIYNNINNSNDNAQYSNIYNMDIYKNKVEENIINSNIQIVETSSGQEKISPNCMFIFKTYFKKCGHLKVEKEQVSETMVNKTKEDLQNIFKDWEIVTYRNDEVLFYKEANGICDEHYLLRELDGYIAIYTVDENNNEILKDKTSILVTYLEEDDIEKIKEGIRVNGKQELNRTIEDYE